MRALFPRTSTRPNWARVCSAIARRSFCDVTSVGTTVARRLSPRTSDAVRSAPARSSSAMTMSAPMRASSKAIARPMPRPAPVTIATSWFSSMVILLSGSCRQVLLEHLGASEPEHAGDGGEFVRAAHLGTELPELADAIEVHLGEQEPLGLRGREDPPPRGGHADAFV